ncbi:endonuclease/exonuclease/phosphatase family protein [Nostoc ellipsosporum NOK]|nr:endonuclease/exonuclease/phosphatase family protein [Nostoc ellipsosporum NOK]
MASKFRVFTKRFLLLINIGFVVLFLVACLAPYLDPQKWWMISLTGLAFPFFLLPLILFLIGWLIFQRKYALVSAIALAIGWKSISVFIGFHFNSGFVAQKDPAHIRIVTWNVARFIEMKRNNNKGSQIRMKMMEQLRGQNADILCLQEFFHSDSPDLYDNLHYISRELKYPYYVYSHDNDGDNIFNGTVIFSRYPMVDSGMLRFPRPTLPEALVHADLRVGKRIIRVYSTHLQSLQLNKSDYEKIDRIKDAQDGMVNNSKTIFSKLRTGVRYRSIQADMVHQVMGDSPYPVLFCGDLNDIPNSYTYFTISQGMQDAFLRKGSGIGRTFSALSPTLRIDYILADKNFRIEQFKRYVREYSDHYMLVSDISLDKQ